MEGCQSPTFNLGQRVAAFLINNLPPRVSDPRYIVFGKCRASHLPNSRNYLLTQLRLTIARIMTYFGCPILQQYVPL